MACLDSGEEFGRLDRLDDVAIHTRFPAPFRIALHRVGRQGDNGHAAPGNAFAETE
jgi:hypothetical protein